MLLLLANPFQVPRLLQIAGQCQLRLQGGQVADDPGQEEGTDQSQDSPAETR